MRNREILKRNVMTCTWLYVLGTRDTIENSYIYIGMTFRLIRRLNEHMKGEGAICTREYNYDTLLGVYKISDEEEHDHEKENKLTHEMMQLKGMLWWKVRGGSSTDVGSYRMKPCFERGRIDTCYCHMPRSEKIRKGDGVKYYCCPRKDCEWMREIMEDIGYEIPEACSYFSYE